MEITWDCNNFPDSKTWDLKIWTRVPYTFVDRDLIELCKDDNRINLEEDIRVYTNYSKSYMRISIFQPTGN